jgi:hypothetical protein
MFFLDKNYIFTGIFSYKLNILYLIIKNLHIFSDKKTNLGLFNLYNPLSLHIFFKGGNINSSKIILKNLKIKYFK